MLENQYDISLNIDEPLLYNQRIKARDILLIIYLFCSNHHMKLMPINKYSVENISIRKLAMILGGCNEDSGN